MTLSSIGDLSISYQLRRDTGRIKSDVTRYTRELSSGVSSDLVARLKGDFGPLADIEKGLKRMESYRAVGAEYGLIISSQQLALDNLRNLGSISGVFLTLPDAADRTLIANAGTETLSRFSSALGTLNTQVAGRSIFAGVDTDQPAVADTETVLTALETEITAAAATTAADVAAVVDAWFALGGGFETTGYLGGPMSTSSTQLSDLERGAPLFTAENEAVRTQLSALALGALLGRDVLSGNLEEQGNLARLSGERLLVADDQVVALQASVGSIEAQVSRAEVEVRTQSDSLQIARAELIEADPFELAVKLQNAETRLQSIYAITARMSQLSLVNYL
ncbi:MAG: flagellin [Paracoccaceae bacterium]|nr:flagellin [Paracoccaceae bacterium]